MLAFLAGFLVGILSTLVVVALLFLAGTKTLNHLGEDY